MSDSSDDVVIRITGQDAGGKALIDQLTASIDKNTASAKKHADAMAATGTASEKAGTSAEHAKGSFEGLSRGLELIATAIAAEKLLEFAKSGIEAQLQISRLSKETGASTESLSILGLATQETGGQTDDLAQAFRGLSRSQAEAQQGNGKIIEAYKAIGLSVNDLAGLKPDELFKKVADAQSRYSDGLGKSAALQQIFGRNAQQLLPVLNAVAGDGLAAVTARAQELGIVLDQETADRVEKLSAQMTDLKAASLGVAEQVTEHLVPGLTDLARGATSAIAHLPDDVKRAIDYIVVFTAAVSAATVAVKLLAGASALFEASPIGLAATAIAGFVAVIGVLVEHERALQQAQLDAIKTEGNHVASARALTAEYERESRALASGKLSATEAQAAREKLKKITQELKDLGPDYVKALGDEGAQYGVVTTALKALNAEHERTLRLKKAELEVDIANLQRDEAEHLQRNAAVFGALHGLGVTAPGVLANPEIGRKQDQLAAIDAALGGIDTAKGVKPDVIVPDMAAAKARIAQIVDAIKADMKGLADEAKADEQAATALFAQGLTDLASYYDRRREIIRIQTEGEILDLKEERAALAKTPTSTPAEATQLKTALAAIDQQIAEKQRGLTTALNGLTDEQRKAVQQLVGEVAGANAKLLQAAGRPVEAARLQIESEVRALGDVMTKAFGPDVAAEVEERFRTTLTNTNTFDALKREADQTFAAIANEKAALDAQLAAGTIGQQAHDDAVTRLERANLPQLHAIGDEMARIAHAANDGLGNPDLIQAANAFNASLDAMGVKTDRAAQAWANFRDNAENALEQDLVTFLGSTINHVTSLGDAFRQLALSAIQSIQQIVAQLIVLDAIKLAKKTFGIGEDDATAVATKTVVASTALGFAGHEVQAGGDRVLEGAAALAIAARALAVANGASFFGFADGGVVAGPGTGTSDSILARVSAGEGILTADTVRRIGPDAVHRLNAGAPIIQLRDFSHLRVPHFAAGGVAGEDQTTSGRLMSAMRGAGGGDLGTLHVAADEGLTLRHVASGSGTRVLLNFVAANRRRIRSALGIK